MALAPATRLGPYEILTPLGAGGTGEVYRARDTRLERAVAIKILPSQFSSDPVRKQRFEREAKTISNLNHPHICVLHDIGSQDGVDYLVMECVEGETLAKRLEKGPLALEQVLKLGRTNRRRPEQSPSQRRGAPRSEAGQHHADPYGREAAGFWLGEAGGADSKSRNDSYERRITGDARGNDCRDVSVHVTGTNRRERAGRSQRHTFSGRRAVRNADGAARFPGQEPTERCDRDSRERTCTQ